MASSGDVGQKAFASLDERAGRMCDTTTSGLDKVVNCAGLGELYLRMKQLYGNTTAWRALMECNAIYLKDVKTAIGVTDDRYGLFYAETPASVRWSPNVGDKNLTLNERAIMRAQDAKATRLGASLRRSSALVQQVLEKSREVKEKIEQVQQLEKKIEEIVRNNNILHRKMQEKNRDHHQKMMDRVWELQKDRDTWMARAAHYESENVQLRMKLNGNVKESKFGKFLAWICVAIIFFSVIQLSEAATPMNESCELAEKGCVVMENGFALASLDFFDIVKHCKNGQATIPGTAFEFSEIKKQCASVFGKKRCEKVLAELLPSVCRRTEETSVVVSAINAIYVQALDFYKTVRAYNLDNYILAIFVLTLTSSKEKMIKTIPFFFVSWLLKIPVFVLTVAANIFPLTALPFVIFHVFYPHMVTITTLLLWITQIMTAFFNNTGVACLVEISYAVVTTAGFFVWTICLTLVSTLSIGSVSQILLFCVVVSVSCGTRFACSHITVVHPDGTTEKVSRLTQGKKMFVNQCKTLKCFLQNRGIIPPSPARHNCIVKVISSKGSGIGWRFMNNFITLGHIVGEDKFVTLQYETVSVKVKVEKKFPLFETTDSVVILPIPKELQAVKSLKLSKQSASGYYTLTCFDANMHVPVSYQGWCVVDGKWINNTFATSFGTSGGPYTDSDGKIFGIHLGSQGVTSQGVKLVEFLDKVFNGVGPELDHPMYQCSCCSINDPPGFDLDSFMEKVINATKVSHGAILKDLDEIRQRVAIVEQGFNQQLFKQAKGKTKKTIRGQKAIMTKKFLTRGHFMKMRMLTEEEYNKLLEEGFTKEEILEVVDSLRQQAWLEYCIDNDIDEEGLEDWYEDMLHDEQVNQEIDEAIEKQLEDEGLFQQARKKLVTKIRNNPRKTMAEQALLHIVDIGPTKVRTVKVEVQKEESEDLTDLWTRMVTTEPTTRKTTAILSNGEEIKTAENVEINWDKLKMIHTEGEKTFERIDREGVTEISTGPDNKKNILREKTTNISPKEEVALEQRKKICRWCGSAKNHNYARCRQLNQKHFCVWCGDAHSEKEGHSRDIRCANCGKTFPNIDVLEKHIMTEECRKN
nr:ORF1a [Mute swan feces associated avastrovius 2]